MIKLRALRPLCGDYSQNRRNGFVPEGDTFETDEAHALPLEAAGHAERVHESIGSRLHKMILGSPENKRLADSEPQVIGPNRTEGPPSVSGSRRR